MEILRREFDALVEDRFIDSEFIKDVVYEWIKENELEDYVKYIRFRKTDMCLAGYYDSENKTVYVDFEKVLKKLNRRLLPMHRRIFDMYTEEEIIKIYSYFFDLIMHEVGHGYEEYLIDKGIPNAHDVFMLSEALADNNFTIYSESHDLFPHEHYADLFGYIYGDEIMGSINRNHQSNLLKKLRYYLTKDYEQIRVEYLSPFDKVLAMSDARDIRDYIDKKYSLDKHIDPIVRLGLGVNASSHNIVTAKKIDNNNLEEVKKRILFK